MYVPLRLSTQWQNLFQNWNACVYSNAEILQSTITGISLGFKCTCSIVVDEAREVMYFACSESNMIVIATLDGRHICPVGSMGAVPLKFRWPMGLFQDKSSDIYVAYKCNMRIQSLSPHLLFKKECRWQVRTQEVAIDSDNNLHVATSSGMGILGSEVNYGDGRSCKDVPLVYAEL